MVITAERYYNISKVKEIWHKLYQENEMFSPFQDYDYVANYCHLYPNKKGRCNVFYVLYQADSKGKKPVMICPLSVSLLLKQARGYEILGGREADIADFIYASSLSLSEAKACLKKLLETLGLPLRFKHLSEDSIILSAVRELYPELQLNEEIYLRIPKQESVEDYIASLSKSTRQNVRTAYNRMKRDELEFELEVAYPTKTNEALYEACIEAYVERQKNFYNQSYILGSKAMTAWYYRHFDPESKSLASSPKSFVSALKINGSVAGVIMAFSHNNTIVVPRLAINSAYNFYSPGVVLLVETMRYLLEHTELNSIDLCLGNERYKYSMGGVEYRSYHFTIPKA